MKTTTLVTLAAALGEATASFLHAKSFSCPSNTAETCDTQQEQGFDWSGLADGAFNSFGGLEFTGFTCKTGSVGKRDALTGRTFGSKAACGVAQIGGGSSIGCGSKGQVDKFSISHFDISVEFDTDLEFHYDMPDGSKCKHRSKCSKSGNTVKNTQCGGAKNVTVVYPNQPSQPSSTCSFSMHTIGFSCGTPTATTIHVTTTAATTSTTKVETTTTASTEKKTSTTATETTTPVAETTTTTPKAVTTSTRVETTTSPITSTLVTTYVGTSTVFTTSVVTVTSCGPAVSNCPAGSHNNTVVLVTQTIALSTTICPITETQTTVIHTTAVETSTITKAIQTTISKAVQTTTTKAETTTVAASTTSTKAVATTTAKAPIETLPCPNVVPSCLNTWLFTISCTDNTDHNCYCSSAVFVDNIFSCIYSYGETDDIIQQAVIYFQGICANHVGSNPAIATGAETVTTIITVPPTATPTGGDYTTVTVVATTVVPCVESGTTIAGSSSTVVVSTAMTVPQVTFQTTVPAGATTSDVVLAPAVTTATGAGETTLYTRPSTTLGGTGVITGTSTNSPVQFTGAASHRDIAFGAIAFGVAGAIVGF